MAERPDEQYDMKHMSPQDNDYDNDWEYQTPQAETNVDEMPDTPSFDPSALDVGGIGITPRGMKRMGTVGVREVFREITGSRFLKRHNKSLFEKTRIEVAPSKWSYLVYEGKRIYQKRPGKGSMWTLKKEYELNNPMQVEFEKAKRSYDESATKQVDDNAGVFVTEETSEEVISEVIDELSGISTQTDFDVSDIGTQVGEEAQQTSEVQPLQAQLNVTELQTKLTSLEDENRKLEKSLRMKDYELNKLRLKGANGDVINAKQQEINDIQAKLKETELERTQLLLDVEVTNEQLTEATNKVRELTEKNKDIDEKYKQFRDAATKQMKAERQEVINRYNEQAKFDKEQARQEYTESMAEIKTEYIKELRVATDENKRARNELDRAKKEIKLLKEVIVKQYNKDEQSDSKKPTDDEGQDGVESVSRGV